MLAKENCTETGCSKVYMTIWIVSQLFQNKNQNSLLVIYIIDNLYAPNFEEVWEAYWFGPVRPSVRPSVRLCVTLALGQEPLKIGS